MRRPRLRHARAALILAMGLSASGCSPAAAPDEDPAVARGRSVYRNVCIACHNANPNLDGSLGPAVADASRELLEARVVHGVYPPGYTPKRPSAAMPKFPHLADRIDDLAAFLAASRDDDPDAAS